MKTKNTLYSSKRSYFQAFIILLLALSPLSNALPAQTDLEKLPAVILHEDSLFWKAYNECDTAGARRNFRTAGRGLPMCGFCNTTAAGKCRAF